ncbi:MAG: oligopeptide transporter, OPT family [Chlamydiae bacterium]|nr:oligopeptide transporter, OPT family [Chlamydiota bacterium]
MKKEFTPYVSANESPKELTTRALVLGCILGLIFCIGNTYLGLKVGMTVSASIPAAVLSMAILRLFFKNVSILENNIVQTIASVGEGLAAGVIFTIPALYLFGANPSNYQVAVLSFLGGILGILFMIPLRRYIIVKEHHVLPFPEGTACAEILKAGDRGQEGAMYALVGIAIGSIYKLCSGVFKFWEEQTRYVFPSFQGTELSIEGSPALLGVGYMIGARISAIVLAGGLFGWWVLVPLIKLVGHNNMVVFPANIPIANMSAEAIWKNYIRYIGAGTMAVGGIFSLIKIIPVLIKTIHVGFKELFAGFQEGDKLPRIDRDISLKWLIVGTFSVIALLWLLPEMNMNLFTIVLLAILGYFFSAVTSITVGIVGSSSNPSSGMVLTTLLITTFLFYSLGWTDRFYLISAITMGATSFVAICLASTTSQDLKTGFLLGATPKKQQIAEIIGLILPSICIGGVLVLLNKAYGFGTANLPAPQATLMAMITEGVLMGKLPVLFVLIGAVIGLILMMLGVSVLPFALGLYLPLSISTATMAGGITHWIVQKMIGKDNLQDEKGLLAASGIVAGDACTGVLIALMTVMGAISTTKESIIDQAYSPIFFILLALLLIWIAKPHKSRA